MPSFANPDGSFSNQSDGGPVRIVTPGTVATETVKLKSSERALHIANTGTTLTTLNVGLPKVAPGEFVEISAGANIGTVAVTDVHGTAISGAPATIAAGAAIELRYLGAANGWVHWK